MRWCTEAISASIGADPMLDGSMPDASMPTRSMPIRDRQRRLLQFSLALLGSGGECGVVGLDGLANKRPRRCAFDCRNRNGFDRYELNQTFYSYRTYSAVGR